MKLVFGAAPAMYLDSPQPLEALFGESRPFLNPECTWLQKLVLFCLLRPLDSEIEGARARKGSFAHLHQREESAWLNVR